MSRALSADCSESSTTAPRAKTRRAFALGAWVIPFALGSVLAVVTAILCNSVDPTGGSLLSWTVALIYGTLLWLWWAGVVELLWQAGKRWSWVLRVSPAGVGLHVIIGVATALVHMTVLELSVSISAWLRFHPEPAAHATLQIFTLFRFGVELLMYALVWFACTAIHTQIVAQSDAMRSLELERQLSTAHLRALQMQLEPHFLFNTLNALTALIELNRSEEALATLEHLNTILRTSLKRSTPAKIPLAQELEIVESYLAIERLRFADRLQVDIQLDPGALDSLVPCFLLQPIIENAVRHGVARCGNHGLIETSARRVGQRLQLLVRDNGPGLDGKSPSGFGVGLSNTRERLAHFYHRDYELRSAPRDSGGFEVSISIPYERAAS